MYTVYLWMDRKMGGEVRSCGPLDGNVEEARTGRVEVIYYGSLFPTYLTHRQKEVGMEPWQELVQAAGGLHVNELQRTFLCSSEARGTNT